MANITWNASFMSALEIGNEIPTYGWNCCIWQELVGKYCIIT